MIWFSYVLMTLLMLSGLFLIGLILLQRGRGGGLAGAFGGMGGQSAFGTKAGDVFTRITIGVAAAWILLCAASVIVLHKSTGGRFGSFATPPAVIKVEPGKPSANAADDDGLGLGDLKDKEPANKPPVAPVKKDDADKKDKPAAEAKESEPAKPVEPKADAAKPDAPKTDAPPADGDKPKPVEGTDSKPADPKPADPKPETPTEAKPK